ncbi:unnamed protein product [Chondrus crispus]|uniref:Secreted protein n=1 Tax=Chondrus crispus TaxID=2769 RepID=R7Q8J6_CHOCR|nr:unnamed protein product [Chondrus crispus]CDF34354.1 unnamed protein product [Chondrus crispus]|eukprot:XP_005714173.1 unnamed protein product [Chondrus crispus]
MGHKPLLFNFLLHLRLPLAITAAEDIVPTQASLPPGFGVVLFFFMSAGGMATRSYCWLTSANGYILRFTLLPDCMRQ